MECITRSFSKTRNKLNNQSLKPTAAKQRTFMIKISTIIRIKLRWSEWLIRQLDLVKMGQAKSIYHLLKHRKRNEKKKKGICQTLLKMVALSSANQLELTILLPESGHWVLVKSRVEADVGSYERHVSEDGGESVDASLSLHEMVGVQRQLLSCRLEHAALR